MIRRLMNILGALGGRRTKIDGSRKLTRLGRDEYKYHEGDRALILQIEMLHGNPCRLIYLSTICRWLPPHDHEEISETDRANIAEVIRLFLESQGQSTVIR